MSRNDAVVACLNAVLCKELTGINQYFIHSKMCKDWGYHKLAKHSWDESIEEMKHADEVIERILYLNGVPNMSKYEQIRVGGTVKEQHSNDLLLEIDAVRNLKESIAICDREGDPVSRVMLETILKEEEEHVDWLETQLRLIEEIGYELYLSKQMGEGE